MTKDLSTLMKNDEYKNAFHMYFQYVARNKRYANIYKKKMEKLEKDFKADLLIVI